MHSGELASRSFHDCHKACERILPGFCSVLRPEQHRNGVHPEARVVHEFWHHVAFEELSNALTSKSRLFTAARPSVVTKWGGAVAYRDGEWMAMTETPSDDATVLIQHSGSGIRSEMKHLEMYLGRPRKFFRSERTAATNLLITF